MGVCGAVAIVEWLFSESVLGILRAHAALATRAWGLVFVALAAAGFAVLSSRPRTAAAEPSARA
jgi:hypothetical protein